MVCHLQNSQSISLSSVNICEVFRSTNKDSIYEVLELFFKQYELDRVLSNISAENPFDVYIEGKMNGGKRQDFS